MKYGKVLSYKNSEEAKKLIGKKVAFCDHLRDIEERPECRSIGILKDAMNNATYPFATSNGVYQFIREVIEESELMTHRQLAEWCAKGNGECSREDANTVYTSYNYCKYDSDEPVFDDIRIRHWDSDEWVIPTVDIYERDCKGGNK